MKYNIMEVYNTLNGEVSKYVHDDGSETAIKTIPGCVSIDNLLTGKKETINDRNKYVVFISTSVGCPIRCKFCYLTTKKYPVEFLSHEQIINNLKEAIEHKVTINPELKNKFVKLSFMGMGDLLLHPSVFPNVVLETLEWIKSNKYAIGLDGIDIATTCPYQPTDDYLKPITDIKNELHKNYINPENKNKSLIRFFYSLHTTDFSNFRKELMPGIIYRHSIDELHQYCLKNNFDFIIHHMFMSCINDSWEDVNELISFLRTSSFLRTNFYQAVELRILRYNKCNTTTIYPTPEKHFNEIIKYLNQNIKKLKVQYSAGSEIKAACGQFLMSKVK